LSISVYARVHYNVSPICNLKSPRLKTLRAFHFIVAYSHTLSFDRFYQLDGSNTREQEGTGIGLALTKDLVELHHGQIEVGDNTHGGTRMIVRLPLGKSHLRAEEITEIADNGEVGTTQDVAEPHLIMAGADEELPAATNSKNNTEKTVQPHVMIVEDNADVRTYIRSILDEDYKITEAENGKSGLAKVAALMPDLIISDIMMPKMDGIEFCEKVKTNEMTSHIPVILLTARAATEDKFQGLETGADDYMIKPFNGRELQIRVKNLIEQRRLLRERFSKKISLQPSEITVTTYDERFLTRALSIVENSLEESGFSTEAFAREMHMSRMQLNRKLQALTNLTTGEFIRCVRLKRAAQLLAKRGSTTITEIAYQVGFTDHSHFSKCFRQQFGHAPSAYLKLLDTKD